MTFLLWHTFANSFHLCYIFVRYVHFHVLNDENKKDHWQMPTGESVYFKQRYSGAPAAVSMVADWFLGVVCRLQHTMEVANSD